VDDLLIGGADVAGLSRRAAAFGLDLSGPHAVIVVRSDRPFSDSSPVTSSIERAVSGAKGDASALVATKEDRLVVVFAAPDRAAIAEVLTATTVALGPRPGDPYTVDLRRGGMRSEWQIGVGRPAVGGTGVFTSYREARDALDLARKLTLRTRVVDARDLLVHHVLLRDRDAMDDLVNTLLTPLLTARGGGRHLLDTLDAYFESSGNAAHTARAMHLSVRAVTYRLARVKELTGYDVDDAGERFALNAAVLGAKLLGWPAASEFDPSLPGSGRKGTANMSGN
ncbi:MAG: helix-turn-helix domain-containing protein, partial [Rhodococcus sp. (in: high G+C Gram-positive bacteria)]